MDWIAPEQRTKPGGPALTLLQDRRPGGSEARDRFSSIHASRPTAAYANWTAVSSWTS